MWHVPPYSIYGGWRAGRREFRGLLVCTESARRRAGVVRPSPAAPNAGQERDPQAGTTALPLSTSSWRGGARASRTLHARMPPTSTHPLHANEGVWAKARLAHDRHFRRLPAVLLRVAQQAVRHGCAQAGGGVGQEGSAPDTRIQAGRRVRQPLAPAARPSPPRAPQLPAPPAPPRCAGDHLTSSTLLVASAAACDGFGSVRAPRCSKRRLLDAKASHESC